MIKNNKNYTTEKLVETIKYGMLEKKASEITTIDLRNIPSAVCDYYIICHAKSNTQVEAIAQSVGYEADKQLSDRPVHIEGAQLAEWILMDYVDVVVHVFQEPRRRFYNLEDLWADAEISTLKENMA
ncbi:MAG: ribosome silencing factor [Bacteroidetes bacterium 4572_77]|nr:MAG: ribosome silencing factor [Bacteroidetes bacterium 4572_77]